MNDVDEPLRITDAMIERGAEVLVEELGEPGEWTWRFRHAAKAAFIAMETERRRMKRNRRRLKDH